MNEPICADCGKPGRRVFVGSVAAIGHAVTRYGGDHHPFREIRAPKSTAEAGRPPVLARRSRSAGPLPSSPAHRPRVTNGAPG